MSETVKILKIGRIENPTYCVLIITDSIVRMQAKRLRDGEPPVPVMIAKHAGKYYPVDNIDILKAYEECNIEDVKCIIENVDSMEEVMERHVKNGRRLAYHPIKTTEAVTMIKDGGMNIETLPEPLQDLCGLKISKGASDVMEKFITELIAKVHDVPPIINIMQSLSKVEKSKQVAAMKNIVKYSKKKDGRVSPPDDHSMAAIIGMFGPSGEYELTEPLGDNANYSRDEADLEAFPRKTDAPISIDPISGTLQFACKCGIRHLVNMKNGTVRELVERDTHVEALESHDCATAYIIPDEDVKYLGMESRPRIFKYRIGGIRGEGATIITSRRSINKKTILGISNLLDNQGRK